MKGVSRKLRVWVGLAVVGAAAAAVGVLADDAPPGGDLDYWLERAAPAGDEDEEASDQPAAEGAADEAGADEEPAEADSQEPPAAPSWALPGVIELSDGTVIAGMMWTAGDEPLEVFVEATKRWRRVPLAAALSITAVVVAERMENVWRWKGTGEDEKVYTGEQYPFRRFEWTVTIADGSEITGVIKGQAVYVSALAGPSSIRILAERTKGEVGQAMETLVYVRRIIISREAMEAIQPDPPIDPAQGAFVH